MSDPMIRLAGRTLGLLPVLQPRLMSMFAVEDGEMLDSPSASNSGGAGIESTIGLTEDRRFMPPSPVGRGIEGEGESREMTIVKSISEPRVEPRIEPKVISRVEPTIETLVQRSANSSVSPDRPTISVPTFTNPLVPPDRPILPLTRLPRSLMTAIVETRFEPVTEQTTELTAFDPMVGDGGRSVASVDPIPLTPLERGDRKQDGLERDLEPSIESGVVSGVEPMREMLVQRSPDRSITPDRPAFPVPALATASTNPLVPSDRLTLPLTRLPRSLMSAIVETHVERMAEQVAEPWRTAPQPPILGEPNQKNRFQSSLELGDLGGGKASNGVNPSESLMAKEKNDGSPQSLESKWLTASNPIALTPLNALKDAVVKSMSLVQPNPAAMNDRATSQNLLKQAKEELLQNLQSVSIDLAYEPHHEFRSEQPANPYLDPISVTSLTSPASLTSLTSPTPPTPIKIPLTKGDLGGSGSISMTHHLSHLEPDILAIRPPTSNPGEARNQSPIAPTIAITIGRISIRGIPPAAPPPSRSTRSNRPQVSLNDYLKSRNGGNG